MSRRVTIEDFEVLEEPKEQSNKVLGIDGKSLEEVSKREKVSFENLKYPYNPEKNKEYAIASFILDELEPARYAGTLFYLRDGKYVSDDDVLLKKVTEWCWKFKTSYAKEVIEKVEISAEQYPMGHYFPVAFKNGYLKGKDFIPEKFESFTPYVIEIDYKPDAPMVQIVEDYLNQLSGGCPDYRKLLLEMMATCLITDIPFKTALRAIFILVGDGQNGKGTLCRLIASILGGGDAVSSVDIQDYPDERRLVDLVGKLVNISEDLTDKPIMGDVWRLMKNISSCDILSLRFLFKKAFQARLTATQICTSNHRLKISDKSDSVKTRIHYLPVLTKVEKADKDFEKKLSSPEALEYWMKLVIEAYQRLYKIGEYTKAPIVEEYNAKFFEANDNTNKFLEEMSWRLDFLHGQKPSAVYKRYVEWCRDNEERPLKRDTLETNVIRKYKVKTSKFRDTKETTWNPNGSWQNTERYKKVEGSVDFYHTTGFEPLDDDSFGEDDVIPKPNTAITLDQYGILKKRRGDN